MKNEKPIVLIDYSMFNGDENNIILNNLVDELKEKELKLYGLISYKNRKSTKIHKDISGIIRFNDNDLNYNPYNIVRNVMLFTKCRNPKKCIILSANNKVITAFDQNGFTTDMIMFNDDNSMILLSNGICKELTLQKR